MRTTEAGRWKLPVLVLFALAVEVACYQLGYVGLRWGWFVGIPLVLWGPASLVVGRYALGLPWKDLGLGWPRVSGRIVAWSAVAAVAALAIIPVLRMSFGYRDFYVSMAGPQIPFAQRLLNLTQFVGSTLPGWELFHRGFLLFGLRALLREEAGTDSERSDGIAVLVVCVFEVLTHLNKPIQETLGMLFLSPLLSALALRTDSLLLPAGLHFLIEVCFGFALAL